VPNQKRKMEALWNEHNRLIIMLMALDKKKGAFVYDSQAKEWLTVKTIEESICDIQEMINKFSLLLEDQLQAWLRKAQQKQDAEGPEVALNTAYYT